MRKDRFIKIGDQEWRLSVCEDGRIAFAYVKPKVWGKDPLDGLWHDWFNPDSIHYQPTYTFEETGVLQGISPFKAKNELMNAMAHLVRQYGKNMVFFRAVDEKRGRIYTNLINEFIQCLGGDWSCQAIENRWFYFTKDRWGN